MDKFKRDQVHVSGALVMWAKMFSNSGGGRFSISFVDCTSALVKPVFKTSSKSEEGWYGQPNYCLFKFITL